MGNSVSRPRLALQAETAAIVARKRAENAFYPFKPILNRIVVRPDPEIDKVGSIFVPPIAKAEECDGNKYLTGEFVVTQGTVLAVGPGRLIRKGELYDGKYAQKDFYRATQLKPGDRVEFRRVGDGRSGVEIKVEGENVLLMREDDVIGKYAEAQA